MRNELERARLRHAHRLTSDPDRSWTRDDLMRIEPVDILAGHAGWPANPGSSDPRPMGGRYQVPSPVRSRTRSEPCTATSVKPPEASARR
jgi:hypothetical protein